MAGADVAVVARCLERLQTVARELESLGGRALAIPVDLRHVDQIQLDLWKIQDTLGPIDILVNNAGVAPLSRAERHTLDKWEQALSINLTAVLLCCQKVGGQMIERGQGGRIINISSVLGECANAVHKIVGDAATKGAVTNITRQLAVEWGDGITKCVGSLVVPHRDDHRFTPRAGTRRAAGAHGTLHPHGTAGARGRASRSDYFSGLSCGLLCHG